jgi:hypothetical protein
MTASAYLSTYYRVDSLGLVADVASIITGLRAALVSSPPAGSKWTEPVSGTFQSPARADGLFLTLTATRISATRIAYVVKDQHGIQVNNDTDTRQDIDTTTGNIVVIMSGPMHVVVDSLRSAPETWCCGIASRAPEPDAVPRGTYFASLGPRNTAGTLNGNLVGTFWVLTPGASAYDGSTGLAVHCLAGRIPSGTGTFSADRFTITGGLMSWPVELVSGEWWLGRFPQAIMTDYQIAVGSWVTVPIDGDGNLGSFRAVGFPSVDGSHYIQARLAVRCG